MVLREEMDKATEQGKDHQRLKRNLELIQKTYTVAELSVVLDISINTWTNRMKEPWKRFSYDDLRMIAHYCQIDFVKLVDGELLLSDRLREAGRWRIKNRMRSKSNER